MDSKALDGHLHPTMSTRVSPEYVTVTSMCFEKCTLVFDLARKVQFV